MKDKEIINLITDSGRANDTVVAHLSPDAVEVLKIQGGVGATNPETGLPEYWGFSDFVAVFIPVAIIAVAVFAPEIIPAIGAELGFAAGSTEAAAAGSAVLGASGSAVTSISQGASPEEVIKSAGVGAVSGAVGGAVGAEVGPGVAGATASGAASGATGAELTGQDVGKGAVSGAVLSGVTSAATQGLTGIFGGQQSEPALGKGYEAAPSTPSNYLGVADSSQPPGPRPQGLYQTTPEGYYGETGFIPKNALYQVGDTGGVINDPTLQAAPVYNPSTQTVDYPQDYTPSKATSTISTDYPATQEERLGGQLISQILSPKILAGLYPSSPIGGRSSTSGTFNTSGSGGTNTALLGQALGTTSDTSLVGSPILGSEDSGKRSQVWNTESLRNALGIG
jgi:hypothetical protein